MNGIRAYAHIKHNQISVNGNLVFQADATTAFPDFLMQAYKAIGLTYPKFHKMDVQCKLGVLCTEYALKDTGFLESHALDKVAIVLSNAASSLETDRQHQHSIADKSNYFPSPAVFVYTLPNIIIGEIAIKHKITGENAFFVSEKPDAALLVNYTQALFAEQSTAAICGWVEVDQDAFEAFIFLVEKTENINKNTNFKPLNQITVTELYNQTKWMH